MSIGHATALSNRQIRKLLNLARTSSKDVFYDLGCGHGQLCIIAAKEFKVKCSVGIENKKDRVAVARRKVSRLGLQNKVDIRKEKIEKCDFSDATIVYDGLSEDEDTLEFYENNLPRGCKLIMPQIPLVSVIPNSSDYPFYLIKKPFKKTKSRNQWATSVLFTKATTSDLIREVEEDPDWTGSDMDMLRKLIRMRFKK